ncbi:hypothetical protein [Saccharopolyspora spinosa]|uniref:hypothetical protein n=1 Tax=Saccharopolyspora spinosa TaxID=60894 RepID=UPI0011D1EE25|nr:hypothetical protein [Saccharopolyspora spinosa]
MTRDVFEAVRAEEARWQEVGAGNQAAVASPMVRGGVVDPALDVFSRVSSVKRAFADAGRALRQLADEQGHGVVDGLYAAADEVQEGSAGNQADAGAVAVSMVRGVGDDPALDVISRVSSVKRAFADAGRALRQLADEQGHGVVDGLYAAADEVLGTMLLSTGCCETRHLRTRFAGITPPPLWERGSIEVGIGVPKFLMMSRSS